MLGGVQLGWNWQSQGVVLGLEADTQLSDMSGEKNSAGSGAGVPYTLMQAHELKWLTTFRGRAGILATPGVLVYATGGLAVGRVSGTSALHFELANHYEGSRSATKVGWTAGGGVEFASGGGWAAKLEYLYYDLGELTVVGNPVWINPSYQTATDIDLSGHLVRIGINRHF